MSSWTLLAVLVLLAEAYFASGILIPLVVSFFLAVLLEPGVAWAERHGLRRSRGAVAAVVLFLLTFAAAVYGFAQPFTTVVDDLPRYASRIRAAAAVIDRRTHKFQKGTEAVQRALQPGAPETPKPREATIEGGVTSLKVFFWRGLGSFFEAAGIAAFMPFLMIFALSDKEVLLAALDRIATGSLDSGLVRRETPRMVRAYFYGNLAVGLVMSLLHWAVFEGLGLQNATGLALLSGFATIIPLIGLPAAMLLPVAQGLLQFDRALSFLVITASMTGLHLIAGNFAVPRVIGARLHINAFAATVGLLFWGWLWGVSGFLLAVPLTALLKILLESRAETAAFAALLATKSAVAKQ